MASTAQSATPAILPRRHAHTLNQLTALGYGSRSYLYLEIGAGRLRALKMGKRVVILEEDLQDWLRTLPQAKIARPARAA